MTKATENTRRPTRPILRSLEGAQAARQDVRLPPALVVRESTGLARGALRPAV
jgi:hypothetical protein